MKVAFVSNQDPQDIHAWSGTIFHMYRMLQKSGFEVNSFGNIHPEKLELLKLKRKIYRRISTRKYLDDRDPLILRSYAQKISKILKNYDYDIIFSPSSIFISVLKTNVPIVFWADATFAGMLNFYENFSNLHTETIKNGHRQEQQALKNCSLAIYSSDWAANSAIENYNVDPSKVKVIPFGANLECNRTQEDITTLVNDKLDFDPMMLLFIGKDWQRKGGPKALEVAKLLNQRGINVELHIVGCTPAIVVPEYVKVHGFISKHCIEGRSQLEDLFMKAHFLLLPSEAEAFGIVFAEASSFGLPSLASNVGGIPSAVRDNINGKTFPIESHASEYCDYILQVINSKERYRALANSSYEEFSNRLNWSAAGVAFKNLVKDELLAIKAKKKND